MNYARAFSQSEMEKYFEWIIIKITAEHNIINKHRHKMCLKLLKNTNKKQ